MAQINQYQQIKTTADLVPSILGFIQNRENIVEKSREFNITAEQTEKAQQATAMENALRRDLEEREFKSRLLQWEEGRTSRNLVDATRQADINVKKAQLVELNIGNEKSQTAITVPGESMPAELRPKAKVIAPSAPVDNGGSAAPVTVAAANKRLSYGAVIPGSKNSLGETSPSGARGVPVED